MSVRVLREVVDARSVGRKLLTFGSDGNAVGISKVDVQFSGEAWEPQSAAELIEYFGSEAILWKVDVWDPRLYDLVINTTQLSYAAAAEIVALAVGAKSSAAQAAEPTPG